MIALALFSVFGRHLQNGYLTAIYIIFMCGMGIAFGNIMTSGQKGVPEKIAQTPMLSLTPCNSLRELLEQR